MVKTAGGCWDLSDQMDNPAVLDALSKLVGGGKPGYKTIIEKRVEVKRCLGCGLILNGEEKFCPECGTKTEWQKAKEAPVVLLTQDDLEKRFKSGTENESRILAYMRDTLKIPQTTAFELINKWRREMNQKNQSSGIDLSQFRG
jgi:hypothetical protein